MLRFSLSGRTCTLCSSSVVQKFLNTMARK